jgi:3',5'-cyclic AMP phosphodiesterase CpdA
MTPLLHLSDTHFGTAQPRVVCALKRLVQAQKPGLAVLSGDITQRATRTQFAEARDFIGGLGVPQWVLIPGNHDIPLFDLRARLWTPYGRYREAFGHDLAPEADTADWRVLSNNTTRWYRHKHGEISRRQIVETGRQLQLAADANPAQIRIVVVHQPVAVQHVEDETDVLRGSGPALRQWSAAGADIVLAGHIHLPFAVPLHQRQPLARPLWAVQAGTAVSLRVRPGAPNSVNLLRASCRDGERQCRLERWDFIAAAGEFMLVREETLALAPTPVPAAHDTARCLVHAG